jgi:hypothetical protein
VKKLFPFGCSTSQLKLTHNLPIDAIPLAPVSAIFAITASTSASFIVGLARIFSITAIVLIPVQLNPDDLLCKKFSAILRVSLILKQFNFVCRDFLL